MAVPRLAIAASSSTILRDDWPPFGIILCGTQIWRPHGHLYHRSGRFCGVSADERIVQKAYYAGHDSHVSQVKHVPTEGPRGGRDVEQDEIGDRPVGGAIDRVADRPADDEA